MIANEIPRRADGKVIQLMKICDKSRKNSQLSQKAAIHTSSEKASLINPRNRLIKVEITMMPIMM